MIADQLATALVPAIRERMLRVRFLTVMAVGGLVTEGLEPNPNHPESPPYQVWEWLVIEAIVRSLTDDSEIWGVPGTHVTKRALSQYGYVDNRSYLKTAQVFGFHGVYKRLAVHLKLVDNYLQFREPRARELIQAWAEDLGLGNFDTSHPLCEKWRQAVHSSLRTTPVRTRTSWRQSDWEELALAFVPHGIEQNEKTYIRRLLLVQDDTRLGAIKEIWSLLGNGNADDLDERAFHKELVHKAPQYTTLLEAIGEYETFCRVLTDSFDILRAEASRKDSQGLKMSLLSKDEEIKLLASRLHPSFNQTVSRISEVEVDLEARFQERFSLFSEPMEPDIFANHLCEHHEWIQKGKSAEGKRSWFDRLGSDGIYMRRSYRIQNRPDLHATYVHYYRKNPIGRFRRDLS
jgi:hypothetical protein